jgi:hypothetical protein
VRRDLNQTRFTNDYPWEINITFKKPRSQIMGGIVGLNRDELRQVVGNLIRQDLYIVSSAQRHNPKTIPAQRLDYSQGVATD